MIRGRGHGLTLGVARASVALALCTVFTAVPAEAQPASTLGFRLGEGRLHPYLELDGRFDSAVGFFPPNQAPAGSAPELQPDIVLHARPGLRFELRNSSTDINLNGSAEYLFFTGAFNVGTQRLSRFQANVAADAAFNKDGPVEIQVGDSLVRSDRTQNPAVGIGVVSWFNTVRVALPIRPGGGALEITPRGAWTVEFFEPLLGSSSNVPNCADGDPLCDPDQVGQLNYSTVSFGLNTRWKFLPKTAAVLDVGTDVRLYWQPNDRAPPATLFRAQVGLVGLITPRLNVTLLAGYGGDFAGSGLHTVIGQAEIGYVPTEFIRVAGGYLRTALPIAGLASGINDRGYLRGTLGLWAGRLTIQLQLNADYLSYIGREDLNIAGRNDFILNGSIGPTVAITQWLDVGAAYTVGFRISPQQTTLASANYLRHEALLRVGVHY